MANWLEKLSFPTQDARKVGSWAFNMLRPPTRDITTISRALPSVKTPLETRRKAGQWAFEKMKFVPKIGETYGTLMKEMIYGYPQRAGIQLGLYGAEKITGRPEVYKPRTSMEIAMLGKKDIYDVETTGVEWLKDIGLSEPTAQKYGLGTGLFFATLDLLPVSTGKSKLGKDAIKFIVKENKVGVVMDFLRKSGVAEDLIEPYAIKLAKTKNKKVVELGFKELNRIMKETKIVKPLKPADRILETMRRPKEIKPIIVPETSKIISTLGKAKRTDPPCVKIFRETIKKYPNAIPERVIFSDTIENASKRYLSNIKMGVHKQLGGFTHIRANVNGKIIESKPLTKIINAKPFGEKQIKIHIKEIKTIEKEMIKPDKTLKQIIKPVSDKITRPESILLKEKLRAEIRGAKAGIAGFKKEQRFIESLKKDIAKELAKPKARQRSTIAFVKKIGELNQTVANEIKKEIGLVKPISQANLTDLNKVLVKMKERLAFKVARGFKPRVVDKVSKPMEIPAEVYKAAREMKPIGKSKIETVKQSAEKFGKSIDTIIQPISTRLKKIDPELKRKLRKFEWNTKKIIDEDGILVEDFLKKIKPAKKAGMSSGDYIEYDLALKNGDIKKITSLNKKYNLEREYDNVRTVLDDIYKRANDVGFDVGYSKNYFPRVIKDTDGFLEYFMKGDDWSKFDEAIKMKEMDLGRILEVEEKAYIINNMIRGYKGGQITLSKVGAMKHRIIDFIDPELNRFYMDSSEALVNYIYQVNDKIEARKFFGKSRLVDKKVDQFNNIDDSIGAYVVDLMVKGKITIKQEKELTKILQARFNEKGTHGIVGTYKNLSYIGVMGSPFNTLTQIGDLGFAFYSGGIKRAVKETIISAFGKSKIKKEDLFIRRIATEFNDASKTSKMVDWTFRKIGLTKIDTIGKESLINSTIARMMKQSKKPTAKFRKELTDIFGKETDNILKDLQKGKITENVKYLAFNKLLDFQPVALSEVPEMYLKAGNGRIFYMLKTWSLKMIDVYRNEAFMLMSKKETFLKGFTNMLKLTGCMLLAEATADEAKDFLLQRERMSIKDRTIDNILKMAMFSRYTVDQAARQGIGTAIALQAAPAMAILDNPYRDLMKFLKDPDESFKINEMRSIQNIPIGGKLYYWWFGKASKKEELDLGVDLDIDLDLDLDIDL